MRNSAFRLYSSENHLLESVDSASCRQFIILSYDDDQTENGGNSCRPARFSLPDCRELQ